MPLSPSLQDFISTQVSDDDTTYTVFQVKAPFSSHWVDPRLHDRVELARKTYQDFYSPDIPLFDEYDPKSAIYVCSATYRSEELGRESNLVREWLSVRFTPYDGEPVSNLDLELQKVFSESNTEALHVLEVLQAQHSDLNLADLQSGIWAISRLCAIRPYIVSEKNDDEIVWSQVYLSNTRTLNCFMLMFRQFLLDFSAQYPMHYFTCQIHPKVAERIFQPKDGLFQLHLPYASEILALGTAKIGLDRSKYEQYILSYPGYFLQLSDLVHVLNQYVQSGHLPESFVNEFLPQNANWSQVVSAPDFRYFSKFGILLTAETFPGQIKITPSELREQIRQRVPDGVQLRMLTREYAQKQIDQLPLIRY